MTQAVAIVTPGFGLVANDTRLMQPCVPMDCDRRYLLRDVVAWLEHRRTAA